MIVYIIIIDLVFEKLFDKEDTDMRKQTKKVRVGGMSVGGGSPVSVQSMTNTDTHDTAATLAQVRALEAAGCDIVRIAVPDESAVGIFSALKEAGVKIPLVADIHFDHRLAVMCAERGADKIRINPGNIGSRENIAKVAEACRAGNIPIRVGVNSGSLEKAMLGKYGSPTPEALAESAMTNVKILEELGFDDIVVAIKSSNVPVMIESNRVLAQMTDHPIHLGVTESGSEKAGLIKSAVGIGTLLSEGIGDTIRVSLTADPVKEVEAGLAILRAAGVRLGDHVEIVACPTCGRTKIDLIGLVNEFESRAAKEIPAGKNLKVAIMGCAVNGPGEAREADIGIAGGAGEVLLFKKGEPLFKIPEEKAIDVLIEEINKI